VSGALSRRVKGLLALAGGAVLIGLASGHPELVVLAVPTLVLVGAGLAMPADARVTAQIELDRARVIEGEGARATVQVRNRGIAAVDVELIPDRSPALTVEPGGPVLLHLSSGQVVELAFQVVPERWGAHRFGPTLVRVRDPLGVTVCDKRGDQDLWVRAFPREQRLRELIAPLRTQPFLGAHVARVRGSGIEFADIRPFAPGDQVRQVNWRATARRGSLVVTDRHPERASDVVFLLDTFAEARDAERGTLDSAVRAAASLARAHLARRDRVALVDFGGTLHWLEPAFGTTQLYRIIDALLASDIAFSYAWRAVESIPRKLLPPGALVVAITPLLDERSTRLVTDLRRRGRDLAIIEVSPLAHVALGPTGADAAAYRLWILQRRALRARLQERGIAVAVWDEDRLLAAGLEGVNAFRRSAAPAVHA
jgi:uncharacterized protein (DUF58 family)